jgi:hypothetical protein
MSKRGGGHADFVHCLGGCGPKITALREISSTLGVHRNLHRSVSNIGSVGSFTYRWDMGNCELFIQNPESGNILGEVPYEISPG